MISPGIRYSNIEPDHDISTESFPTGVSRRPRRNQCRIGTSPLAIAMKLSSTRLGREQVVAAGVERSVGRAIADGEEHPRRVEQEAELHRRRPSRARVGRELRAARGEHRRSPARGPPASSRSAFASAMSAPARLPLSTDDTYFGSSGAQVVRVVPVEQVAAVVLERAHRARASPRPGPPARRCRSSRSRARRPPRADRVRCWWATCAARPPAAASPGSCPAAGDGLRPSRTS